MRTTTRAATLLFFLVLIPSAALAQSAQVCAPHAGSGGILTGLATQFSTTTASWTTTALGYAQGTFFALVGVEVAWSAITYVLKKDSLPDFVAALTLKLLSIGFFFTLLQPQFGPAWIADILSSFLAAGSGISGQPSLGPTDPSSVFNCGTDIAGEMLQSAGQSPFSLGNMVGIVVAILAAFCVVIAFAIVAGQLLMTLIESYIIMGAGVFMLGFTGSRWTLVFGERYVGYAFSVGVKLFMLELIVGLGYGLGASWANLFASSTTPPPETYIEVVGAAFIFGLLAWQIPSLAASMMNGSPRMTLGNFLGTTGAAVAAGTVVGAGASALVQRAAAATQAAASVGIERTPTLLALNSAPPRSDPTSTASPSSPRAPTPRSDSASTPALSYMNADFPEDQAAISRAKTRPQTNEQHARGAQLSGSEQADDDERSSAKANSTSSNNGADTATDTIAADESKETRATDATIAREDKHNTDAADRQSTQNATDQQRRPPRGPSVANLPHVPSDAAEGSISIRFSHPE